MAKTKVLRFAFGGSVVGILGYFLPWVTVRMFVEGSISGFSLVGMLFGVGSGNLLHELGYSAGLIIPALLLTLAATALLFTGIYSALTIKSNNVNRTSGILLTIVSGLVFLIVAGLAMLVSISIKGQLGPYLDVGSYIRYGVGIFVTSLSALVVVISGIFIFQQAEHSESNALGHFGQGEIPQSPGSHASGMGNQTGLPVDNQPPTPGTAFAQPQQNPLQPPVLPENQPNFIPSPVPRQQNSINSGQPWLIPQNQGRITLSTPQISQQTPHDQPPPYPGQTVQNKGWGLTPQSATPPLRRFQPPASVQSPKPWQVNQGTGWKQRPVQPLQVSPLNPQQPRSGNQQQGSNTLPKQPFSFRQINLQAQSLLNQANNQPPLDKPWERVQYSGPRQATLTPRVPPVLPLPNATQDLGRIQPPSPSYSGQEDSHTRGDFFSPQEDPDFTRYDRELDDENSTSDNKDAA